MTTSSKRGGARACKLLLHAGSILGKSSDDVMRSKEHHEGKGKAWACTNHDLPTFFYYGVTHVMIAAPY